MPIAFAIHLLTSFGGVCALEAVLCFVSQDPRAGFLWLGGALIVDGIDGPLARRFGVKQAAPHISGEVLDLVVDFLTYVFAPVVALLAGGFLDGAVGRLLAAGILMSSLIYFADDRMKDEANRFVGFPALWNVVAFYVVALGLQPAVAGSVVVACIALTFVPLRWVHPLRVVELRGLTVAVTALWAVVSVVAVLRGFPAEAWTRAVLLAVLAYWLGLTAFWAIRRA